MTAAELLANRGHVLLDFDGPVCAVFGGIPARTVADKLRPLLDGDVPDSVTSADDPFDVLRYAGTVGTDAARSVDHEFRRLELEAVAEAPMTTGLVPTLHALTNAGHSVTIVSNNADEAVRRFLELHDLWHVVSGVSARRNPDPALLKPNPYLVNDAIQRRHSTPERCVVIGDSISDIQAARAAGTAVIAHANKPGKDERLKSHTPDAIIRTLEELRP